MNVEVVFAGHIDHGKSTLIGRLLYDSESITDGRVTEIQQIANEYKKRFEFAYFIDSFEEELKEEKTIDTVQVMFKGKNFYTITDVPGHKEFIKNMLTGASHASVAILVVSAPEGVQEQTGRHAFLLKMLGIKKLFVLINKMDLVGYKEEAFIKIKEDVEKLLTPLGYSNTEYIAASAYQGDNIYKTSSKMDWYTGPTLIQALDNIPIEEEEKKPLRFVVQDIYHIREERIIVGRIESGVMKKNDLIMIEPSGVKTKIDAIKVFEGNIDEAKRGDCVGIIAEGEFKRGDVCGLIESPPRPITRFLGEVVLLDKKLKKGDEFNIKCTTQKIKCQVNDIRERLNSETGEILEKNPEEIYENDAAIIDFNTDPMVVESFSEIPELGRFILVRDGNIGAGVVLDDRF
jgi:small GTP-binding protein